MEILPVARSETGLVKTDKYGVLPLEISHHYYEGINMKTAEFTNEQTKATAASRAESVQFSNALPVWKFVLLTVLTFSVYEIIWFNRNWRQLKAHKNLDIRPGLRTAGLFVPIYGLVLIYRQLSDIREFSKGVGLEKLFSPGSILLFWIIFSAAWKAPDPYWLISNLSVLPLTVVQGVLNSYWKNEQTGLAVRQGFSGGQIALLVIGAIVWVLVLIGMFVPE